MSTILEMQIEELKEENHALKVINQKLQVEKNELKEKLNLGGVSNRRELLAISCLNNIVEPINYLKELAEVDGSKLDGSYAIHLTKQGMFYQNLAKEALREIDNCG